MWIRELSGENFSGMNFSDKYEKNEVKISGRNKSGKSTRIKAFFWLLSGYTNANEPLNSNLFDNRHPLTKDTPEARVWAKVVLDNGEEYMIERIARAKFQRRRGTDSWEKSASDEYVYKIDNIDRSASDFREWISANICPDDMLRFCLDGSFFLNICFDDKKKARAIIEQVVGEVKREEMTGNYSDIDELLGKYSPDEIDQRAANMSKGIDKRLDEIPSLITSKTSELSEIEQTDFAANDKEIARLEGEREACEKRLLDLTERMKPQMEARAKAISEKQMKQTVFDEAYKKWFNEPQEEIARLTGEINAINRQNAESKAKHDDAVLLHEAKKYARDNAIIELKIAEEKRQRLTEEAEQEKAKTFDPSSARCSYCGHTLTGEQLEQARKRFESIKRENYNKIVAEGKSVNTEIERLEKVILDAQPYIDAALPEIINQSTTELEMKIKEITGMSRKEADFEYTELGRKLKADIDAIVIPEVNMPDDSDIKAEKDNINSELIPLYEKRGLKSRGDKLRKNIEDLRTEQREKGTELATYERQRQLVKQYKQEQMEILSHKVNDGLKESRIECWSQQKDGTVVQDLVIKDSQGVNFQSTNNASRIKTTIDIQRFFCEKLVVNMPTFCDESSIFDSTNLPHVDNTQMFYLFCADTPLTVETK